MKSAEFAPDIILPTCSAEDLFVMKAFASRPQDWIDALLEIGSLFGRPQLAEGMVEMQRRFRRAASGNALT
jgi:hypothetical protein